MDRGFALEGGGVRLKLYGMWPNLVRTPTLPPEGIVAPLCLWSGKLEDLDNRTVEGRIVVAPFGADRWLDLFQLGAEAVIFLAPESPVQSASASFLDVPADLPRFYADSDVVPRLVDLARKSQQVRLTGRMNLAPVIGTTLIGVIPGHSDLQPAALVAPFDAVSPVPALSPGAGQSCSAAALLELASELVRRPPGRTVLLIFTSGHYQNMSGMRHLVKDLQDPDADFAFGLADLLSPGESGANPAGVAQSVVFFSLDLSARSRLLSVIPARVPYRRRSLAPPFTDALFSRIRAFEDEHRGGRRVVGNGLRRDGDRLGLSGVPITLPIAAAPAALAGFPAVSLPQRTTVDGIWIHRWIFLEMWTWAPWRSRLSSSLKCSRICLEIPT